MPEEHVKKLVSLLNASDWEGLSRALRIADLQEQSALLAQLGRLHGSEVDLIVGLQACNQACRQHATRHLLNALAHARLETGDIVRLVQACASLDKHLRHQLANTLRAALAGCPSAAQPVRNEVLSNPALASLVEVWASSFVSALPGEAAKAVVGLPADSPKAREVIALLVERLQPLPEVIAALRTHEDDLLGKLLQDAPTSGVEYSANWAAVRALAHFHVPAMGALLTAARSGHTPALIALANWLPLLKSPAVGATNLPVGELLGLLLQQAASDMDFAQRVLDDNISALFYNDSLRCTALQALHRLMTFEADVAHVFEDVFSAVADNRADFATLLTTWLLSSDAKLTAVRSLLSMCMSRIGPVTLDAGLFMAAPSDRQVIACRRLLNLTMDGDVLCGFIGILAEDPALQPQGLAYARQMLPAAMDEYPGATEKFLRARTQGGNRGQPFSPLYRSVLATALQWRRVLKQLPRRGELVPTDSQRQALRAMQQRRAQAIIRSAREQSVFLAAVTSVHTAQGRRWVTYTEQGVSSISAMASQSHAIELPSSELSDPLGALIRRRGALRASQ